MTSGRKSTASLETILVDVRRTPIEPPADLQPGAASVFNQIVGSVEPHHFRKSDVHLLASLSQAIFLARFYSRLIGEDPTAFKAWSEAVKLQNSLSTKLRLTPSSRVDQRHAERSTRTNDVDPPWALAEKEPCASA